MINKKLQPSSLWQFVEYQQICIFISHHIVEHLIGFFVLCGEEKMGERNPAPPVYLEEVVFPEEGISCTAASRPKFWQYLGAGSLSPLFSLARWTKAPIKRSKATRVLSPSVWSITLLVRSRRSFDIGFSFPGAPVSVGNSFTTNFMIGIY